MLNVSISRTIVRIKMGKQYLRLKQLLLTLEWDFSRLLYYRNVKENKKKIENKHISDNAGIPNMGMQAYLSGLSYQPNGLLNNHGNRVTVTRRFWTSIYILHLTSEAAAPNLRKKHFMFVCLISHLKVRLLKNPYSFICAVLAELQDTAEVHCCRTHAHLLPTSASERAYCC